MLPQMELPRINAADQDVDVRCMGCGPLGAEMRAWGCHRLACTLKACGRPWQLAGWLASVFGQGPWARQHLVSSAREGVGRVYHGRDSGKGHLLGLVWPRVWGIGPPLGAVRLSMHSAKPQREA